MLGRRASAARAETTRSRPGRKARSRRDIGNGRGLAAGNPAEGDEEVVRRGEGLGVLPLGAAVVEEPVGLAGIAAELAPVPRRLHQAGEGGRGGVGHGSVGLPVEDDGRRQAGAHVVRGGQGPGRGAEALLGHPRAEAGEVEAGQLRQDEGRVKEHQRVRQRALP